MAVSITIKIDGASLRDKPRRRVVLGLILGAALALPVGALAGHRFTDVPTTHTFHGNIDNLADAGITAGCGPTSFCPEAPDRWRRS
jgi:lipoprotein signal peptidase